MIRIRNGRDFWSGVMFATIGAFFAAVGASYEMGTAADMGPGYVPTALGVIVIVLGLVIAANAISSSANEETVEAVDWRSLFLVLVPVALFGVLLPYLGLVVSLLMLVLLSSLASHEFSWRSAVASAAFLLVFSLFVFVYMLQLQFSLWPSFISG
jgi:hypothetical protein